jgi:hypothetical protein
MVVAGGANLCASGEQFPAPVGNSLNARRPRKGQNRNAENYLPDSLRQGIRKTRTYVADLVLSCLNLTN